MLTSSVFDSDSEYKQLFLIQTINSYNLNHITSEDFIWQNGMSLVKISKKPEVDDLLLSVIDETMRQIFNEAGTKVIYDYLMNRERDSVQTTKFVNNKDEVVCEIHVILSKSGYTVMPYFNEGRRLTVDEKINNHIEVLLEKAPSVLADIQEHFKKELAKAKKANKQL